MNSPHGSNIKDPIFTPADLVGSYGMAWLCDLSKVRAGLGVKPEEDASIALWIIEAPMTHPFWHSYVISLVHLRPIPVAHETLIYLDGATHEIVLSALNPDVDRNDLFTGKINPVAASLRPSNFAAQLIEESDESAMARVRNAVQAVCDGRLSPDTDFIRDWVAIFGDNMMKDRPYPQPPRTVRA